MEHANILPIDSGQQGASSSEPSSCSDITSSQQSSSSFSLDKSSCHSNADLNHPSPALSADRSSSKFSRSLSSTSTKSVSSISTACDSCVAHKAHLSKSANSSTRNSLVICNFNTSNASMDESDAEQSDSASEDEEDSFSDDSDEEDEPADDDDDIDMLSYHSGFSDSALASDILLAFEDAPDFIEGVQGSSTISTSKQRRHILFLETHAIGKASLDLHPEYYPLIVDKICSNSDLHQVNKYIFLLDQFARLCANYSGEDGTIRRCSFYPFLFPHPLPSHTQRPFASRRNRYLRKCYSNAKYRLQQDADYSSACCTPYGPSKRGRPPLSYLDRPFLETYLELIELFTQANAQVEDENQNCDHSARKRISLLKIAHFCLKIFAQFPELIRDDLLEGSRSFQLLPRMMEHLLDPFTLYEPMDNYRFVGCIRAHFHCLEGESEVLNQQRHDSERILRLFDSLYGRFHLPQLFQLYYSVSRYIRTVFCKAVCRRYPEARHLNAEQKEELVNKFYEFTFRHRKAPLLDILHDLSSHTSSHTLGDDHYHRLLLVFCYRSTLFRHAHCVTSSLDRDFVQSDPTLGSSNSPSHSYHQHPIRHISEPLCSTIVGHLYKLTIQLTLLASVYSPPQGNSFLEQLLKIQVFDFDFKQFLQQALDIVESELNSINFDLQNRQHDHNPLVIDSEGMDEFEHEEIDPLPRLATLITSGNGSSAMSPFFSTAMWSAAASSTKSISSLDSTDSNASSEELDSSGGEYSRPTSTTPPPSRTAVISPSASFDVNNNNTDGNYRGGSGPSSQSRTSRPPPPNTPIDIAVNLQDKRALLDKVKSQGMALLAPPNNRWSFQECSVCCDTQWLLVRSCCSFAACLECLARYYTNRIELGNLSIECIGSDCHELVYRAEVNARLSAEKKALYNRMLLLQSSESDRSKPCPQCNTILTLTPQKEREMKQASNRLLFGTKQLLGTLGLRRKPKQPAPLALDVTSSTSSFVYDSLVFKVECDRCKFFWCFKCHSPWHEGLSCKQFMKGDTLLKSWAKNVDFNGQVNAQKCPKCKIYIQRTSGCDHMLCTRCKTDFCYKCGDRLRQVKFFGDHYSRLSVLGCKYRYKPDKPLQRKLIRGTVFGSKLMLLPVLSTVCLCAGAVVLALGIAALPLFGGVRVYRRFRRTNGNHRRTGRSNINVIRAHAEARNHRALQANAANEDVWNRTVQLYSTRLRNRGPTEIRIPGTTGVNNNNIATQTTPHSPRNFQFSWFDSSLMLNGGELEFAEPDFDENLYHHTEHDHHHYQRDLLNDIFHVEDIDDNGEKANGELFASTRDEIPYPHRTTTMKLSYDSPSGRNGVVLKLTEQDLNEIIDESYPGRTSKCHRSRHTRHHKSKSTKAKKSKDEERAPKDGRIDALESGTEAGNSQGETERTHTMLSMPTPDQPIVRKSAMETLVRKLTINRGLKC